MALPFNTLATAVGILSTASSVIALQNGVGKLPVMGYNAWNVFQCNVNESLIIQTA